MFTKRIDVVEVERTRDLEMYPPLHRRILVKAAELAEPAVRLTPPFDRVIKTRLEPRTRYWALEALPPNQVEQILQDIIAAAKFAMCGEAFRDPAAMQRLREFDQTYFLSKYRSSWKPIRRNPEFNEQTTIISGLNDRYQDFIYQPNLFESSGLQIKDYIFCKQFLDQSKLLIAIGAIPFQSTALRVAIGISVPFYIIRDADLWCTSSSWLYWDAESCKQALNDALDVVDIILSPFIDKMGEALGNPSH